MIVMKFGGTSVGDAAAINRVAEIVQSKLDRAPVVVVSAMTRETDGLLGVARIATERRYEEAAGVIEELRQRHLNTVRELMAGRRSADAYSLEWAEHSINYQFNELSGLARSVATLGE